MRTIVTLCGSTRFFKEFQRANYEETMKGHIVLSVGFFGHAKEAHDEAEGCTADQKEQLDQLHFDKIRMSHEVLILNKGGYVGESTKNELALAILLNRKVRWLEPEAGEKFLEDHAHAFGKLVARAARQAKNG